MTLVVENVQAEFVPSLKAFAKAINAKCKVQEAKLSKFEKSVLKAEKQIQKDIKSGTLKAYKSAKQMHEDILGEILFKGL